MTRTVAFIGAGFSGTLVAVHLLRSAASRAALRVVLIDRSTSMARGLAYATDNDLHLLNVPAGGMSALADDPQHFLRYCHRQRLCASADDFLPRATYGRYLEDLLDEAERSASGRVLLERRVDSVLALTPGVAGRGAYLSLREGGALWADQVVLASGHFPPAEPAPVGVQVRAGGRYLRDPWAAGALHGIAQQDPIGVLGSGLTALDTLIALRQRGHRGEILCLSRRGLRPQAQRSGVAPGWQALETLLPVLGRGARAALRALREGLEMAAEGGLDWRDALASLRVHTASIWQAWPLCERRRFLRHLQAYWEVHRHRCAPSTAALLAEMERGGRLRIRAGRLLRVETCRGGLELAWRARGERQARTHEVAWLINCTGPDTRLQHTDCPLIAGLLRQGLICPDELGLGLRVAEDYAVIGAAGLPWPALRYLGPLLKARDWEATAVPELRVHARQLAEQLSLALTGSEACRVERIAWRAGTGGVPVGRDRPAGLDV